MGRAGSTSWESLRTRFASSGLGPAVRPRLPDHRPRTGTRGRGSKIGALFNPSEAVNPCVQAIAPGARISLFGLQDSCSSRASPPLQPKGGLVGPGSHRRPAFSGGQNGPVLAARSRLTSVSSVGVRWGREDSSPFEPEGGSGLYQAIRARSKTLFFGLEDGGSCKVLSRMPGVPGGRRGSIPQLGEGWTRGNPRGARGSRISASGRLREGGVRYVTLGEPCPSAGFLC
jgi:hypothetical protein